jgi:hypothetical protein
MDERRRVRLDGVAQPKARGNRPAAWALAVVWLAVGVVVVGQVQLPRPARSAPTRRPAVAACWVVRIASRPASASSLRRDLRTLRRAGLAASLRPGRRPGSRELAVLARSRAAARVARDRAVRLGLSRGTVRRLPRAACRR